MTISKSLVWNKLRAALGELRQSLVATQLHDVLDQEIKDADQQLRILQARHDQAKTLVSHSQKHIQSLKDNHKATKASIAKLLRAHKDDEARPLAVQAARQTQELEEWAQRLLEAQHNERFALLAAEQMSGELRRLKSQLAAIKTSDTLRRTQELLAKQDDGATPPTVLAAKNRVQQQNFSPSASTPTEEDVDAILKDLAPKQKTSNPKKVVTKKLSRQSKTKDRS